MGSAAVVTTLALGACGSDDAGSDAAGSSQNAAPDGATEASTPSGAASADGSAGPTGTRLAGTDEFPVGGGKVVSSDSGVVVVTQPSDGQFKAFNGKCPHQGCSVTEVTENVIVCQCHGSTFDGSSGDRLDGPSPTGLTEVGIAVEGDSIFLA
jgi:nitrite reductase/ring-hydroxylating ferredoxin subunit